MPVTALGYMGVRSPALEGWSDYAGRLLGMELVDKGGKTLAFRMDDWRQRLIIMDEAGDEFAYMGWQVSSAADLDYFGARIEAAGIKVTEANRALCDQRFVERMIYCNDPDGNRVELFSSPVMARDPFTPGRPIEGFLTGPYGMGHAVLHVMDVEPVVPFYRDLLGFSVSDYGLSPYGMYFFHVTGRHHSFAMIGTGRRGLHHFMVEYQNLDDVGQGYDLAQMEEDRVAYTLGRHTNDYMTSFYAKTPSDFFIESGWGGRVIDVDTWQPHETHVGPSFWGHERVHLPDEQRRVMREMRLKAAADGKRTPNLIDCPWLYDQLGR